MADSRRITVDKNDNSRKVWTKRQAGAVVKGATVDVVSLGFESRTGQIRHNTINMSLDMSSTTCRRCDISSKLCCLGTKPRRWATYVVTCFGEVPHYNKDLIIFCPSISHINRSGPAPRGGGGAGGPVSLNPHACSLQSTCLLF